MPAFKDIINSGKPVLVDFFAEWCGPCKMMAPILKAVKDKVGDSITILKVDVDKNPGAAASYNVQGPKLAVTNSEGDPNGARAFEMPRHLIDITLNKFLAKHWGVKLRVRNALNAPLRRSYEFASGYRVDFDKYTYGSEYQLTVSYTIK